MRYGRVSGLDKDVSKIVLGSVPFGDDQAKADALLDAFVARGGNAVDTAHIYYSGRCTRVFGNWMAKHGCRDRMVCLDKGCHPYGKPRFTPEDLDNDLLENLANLQTDHVDIWVFHRDNPEYPLEPILQRLNEHIAEGRMQAFGGSNWSLDRTREALAIAEAKGWQGPSLNNPNLSLATVNEPMWAGCVTIDAEGRAWHEATQFPLFSWSSVGGGFFAGVDSDDVRRVYHNEENDRRKARLEGMAAEKGCSPTQLALAWTLNQPFPVWALVGCNTVDEVSQACDAVDLSLTPEELRWLEFGDRT
ncbi:MAG: aldo/keto reductase [Nitrospirae bacterium]|nr:aldo/keto reductase [Fimbriimonadaceae bacterium]